MKLKAFPLACAGATMSALIMLLLSVANSLGIYQNAAAQMQGWHMFYEPTFLGTISGMIEAAVFTYLVLFVFAWLYNRLAK